MSLPDVQPIATPRGHAALRRVFDIGVTLVLLPFVLLVGGIVAVLIMLDSPGGVFYRQKRVGRHGRQFTMLKFRKMRHAAGGGPLTIGADERFTPIGSLLALTKLDEMPQLLNVVRGDMHLIGPRPEVPEFVDRYRDSYDAILAVRPGITGPAAIEYASESHLLGQQVDPLSYYSEQIMPRKISIDTRYVQTRTLVGDMRILAATFALPFARVQQRMRRSAGHSRHAVLFATVLALSLTFVVASIG